MNGSLWEALKVQIDQFLISDDVEKLFSYKVCRQNIENNAITNVNPLT